MISGLYNVTWVRRWVTVSYTANVVINSTYSLVEISISYLRCTGWLTSMLSDWVYAYL